MSEVKEEKFVIGAELLSAFIRYLYERPFKEVNGIIQAMSALKKLEEPKVTVSDVHEVLRNETVTVDEPSDS